MDLMQILLSVHLKNKHKKVLGTNSDDMSTVLDCIDRSLTVYLSHLSTELHSTQPVSPHTLYPCAKRGNWEEFLVDAEP